MHVAAVRGARRSRLLPALAQLRGTLAAEVRRTSTDIVKIGRTHLQDATPLTLGQEFSGYVAQLDARRSARARRAAASVRAGAGRHRRRHRPERAQGLCRAGRGRAGATLTGLPFVTAPNKFAALASRRRAGACARRAQDAGRQPDEDRQRRALAGVSGPRSGIGELSIPENEPGSSIMPGKVNPTQCEARDDAVPRRCSATTSRSTSAAPRATSSSTCSSPMVAHNFLQSVRLLADGMAQLQRPLRRRHRAEPRAHRRAGRPLADAGDRAQHRTSATTRPPRSPRRRTRKGSSLREAAVASAIVTGEQFDQWVVPENMTGR